VTSRDKEGFRVLGVEGRKTKIEKRKEKIGMRKEEMRNEEGSRK